MWDKLRNSLLSPLAAILEKGLDRLSHAFQRQKERQDKTSEQIKTRFNMLAQQVDEARNEFHRGFRIQESLHAGLKQQLDQITAEISKLKKMRVLSAAGSTHAGSSGGVVPQLVTDRAGAETADEAEEIQPAAGAAWLAAQRVVK